MLGVATRRGVKSLYLEVRISNDPARALYERFGFRQVGRRADYYDAPREDALVMMKRL
jgi:ribosomal-protein-alanine N-acetyltransferase